MLINKTEFGFLVSAGKYYLHIIHYGDNVVRFAYSDSEDLPVSTAAVDARPLKTECEFEDVSEYMIKICFCSVKTWK